MEAHDMGPILIKRGVFFLRSLSHCKETDSLNALIAQEKATSKHPVTSACAYCCASCRATCLGDPRFAGTVGPLGFIC